jgi:hypothetical protein
VDECVQKLAGGTFYNSSLTAVVNGASGAVFSFTAQAPRQSAINPEVAKRRAYTALDRQNLEKVIAEGEAGYYTDESNFVRLGTVVNVQYILNGALQKTASGFSLQLKVSEAATGASKAAYTGNVPAAELENLGG